MKCYRVTFKPDAVDDLIQIYEYISDQTGFPERAWRYIEKLRQKCEQLEYAPERGHLREDLGKGIRILAIYKHAVAAFIIDDVQATVTFINVFYGGRDYEALFHK
jgi:toxin ParE1/3/4